MCGGYRLKDQAVAHFLKRTSTEIKINVITMKRKLLSILALLCLAVSGAWAAVVNCQPSDIGKLLGSDGNVYATATDFPDGVTVSGMIAYINTSEHWGLVIGPVDLNSGGTHGSEKVNQSTAVTVCSGYNRELPAAASTGWSAEPG